MDKTLQLRVKIFSELGKLVGPLVGIGKGAGEANSKLKGLRTELAGIKKTQADLSSFKALREQMRGSGNAIEEARRKSKALSAEIAAAARPTQALRREHERAQATVRRLVAAQKDQVAEAVRLKDKLREAGVSVRSIADAERQLESRTDQANAALKEQQAVLDRIGEREARLRGARASRDRLQGFATNTAVAGASGVAAGRAVGAPILSLARDAMGLEEAMADVRKVVDFPTPQAFTDLRDELKDLSTEIPIAAEGLAQILAAGARAGVSREELVPFTRTAAEMGVAFEMSADEAGATMATWRAAFKLTQPEVTRLGDQINALTNTFGGDVGNVSAIVTRIGPLAGVAGAGAAEVAAIGQVMEKAGVQSEIASTGIKNMMLSLTKGGAATKQQRAAMEALGLSAEGLAAGMQKDAAGTIMNVLSKISGLSKDRQASVLTQLFGSESVAAIAPVLANLDALRANFAMVGDEAQYAGSMHKEYLARVATTKGATGLAQNALKAVNIQLGEALLPDIIKASEAVKGLANDFRGWAKAHPGLASGLVKFAAILAIGLLVLGGLGIGLAAVIGPFAMLRFALVTAGPLFGPVIKAVGLLTWSFIRMGLALLANPMTWVILGIVAAVALLAGGAYLLIKHWDKVKAFFEDLGARFSEFGRNLIDGLMNGIRERLEPLRNLITSVANMLPEGVKKALGIRSPSRVFAGLGDNVMEGLSMGLQRSERTPLADVRAIAGRMTAALAIGAAAPASAAGAGLAPSDPAPGAWGGGGDTYNVAIHAAPGMDAQALARLVRQEIERLQRAREGDRRAAFADRD